MDVSAYLERIGDRGSREPTADTLRRLHRAHLFAVPFENLDIHLGRPIVLSLPSFYDKIVQCHRGGFCYELNGLFGWLLEQLGFTVTMLSARVHQDGRPGPEFDHLTLLIDGAERWIADVGFGDSFVEPLRLDGTGEEAQRSYRVTRAADGATVVERRRPESGWEPQYSFSPTPRGLDEFSAMCHYQQTSPESSFTRKTVCSLATPEGRITLSNGRLIVTDGGRREERDVATPEAYRRLLSERFGIDLGPDVPVDRLMAAKEFPGT